VAVAVAVASVTGVTVTHALSTEEKESEQLQEIAPQIRNRRRSEKPISTLRKTVSAPALPTIQNRRRYQKPTTSLPPVAEPASKSPKTSESSIPESKPSTKAEQRRRATKVLQKKHEILLEKLKELNVGENLEIWLKSVNIPKEINIPELRAKIAEFIKNKSWEIGRENSRWLLDGSLTKRLWQDFKELSTAKQIVIIIALSILIALVGFLTLQLLSLLWPGLLGLGTSAEGILVEIGVEAFKQRQEPAFHLLMDHAEQAKPLTTAWANQYVLWKYMRRP